MAIAPIIPDLRHKAPAPVTPGGAAPSVIPAMRGLRKVCFVTGTRAEFGLMRSTLESIRDHGRLGLQLVCTGMHLDPAHGRSIDTVRAQGWTVDAEIHWDHSRAAASPSDNAASTGRAIAGLAEVFHELNSDVVLVVGDRVEAFAAAAAAHISHRVVAHVHGGDRALGQVDDALRHSVSKLAHVHFPATRQSAERLKKMGEDPWRIHRVGSPGIDGIRTTAATRAEVAGAFPGLAPRRFALLVLHPTDGDLAEETRRAETVLAAVESVRFDRVVVVYPNNDPGSRGIMRCWDTLRGKDGFVVRRDVPRALFLGLMRDAAVLVGNSSSGVIEAASFGTPVVDVGPRQSGREHGANLVHVPFDGPRIARALSAAWNNGRPRRRAARNVYGGGGAGGRIAGILAGLDVNARLLRKLITY